jgi:RNA polymerase sigma factor (sigma-70 family)
MAEDNELLRRYAEERDEIAFRTLVDRHIQFVYTTARRRLNGDQHAAQDVAQLVFTAVAKQARTLSGNVVFPAWLYRTTSNISIDFVRAQTQRRRREKEVTDMQESSISVSPEMLRPLFDAVIDELSEKDRAVIVLRFFSQLSLAQVGAALRVSEDAARMRVERALLKLETAFARRGITSTAAALAVALGNEALLAAPEGIAARVCHGAISAAATPGTAVTIGFMVSTKTWITGVALLAALGMLSFQIYQWRVAADEQAGLKRAVAELAARAQRAEADVQKAEYTLKAVQQRIAAVRPVRSNRATAPSVAASSGRNGSTAATWDPYREGAAFMDRHPEVRDALRDYVRARARFSYGPFLDTLALSPEQREQMELWLMRGAGMGAMVPGAASEERQLTLTLPGYDNPATPQWMEDTLGPEGMRRLEDYHSRRNAVDDAARVAGALWNSDAPLTADQAARLANVFADHRKTDDRTQVYDWDGIMAAAASFLPPSGLSAIEALRTQAEFNAILSRPVSDAPTATGNRPPHS